MSAVWCARAKGLVKMVSKSKSETAQAARRLAHSFNAFAVERTIAVRRRFLGVYRDAVTQEIKFIVRLTPQWRPETQIR